MRLALKEVGYDVFIDDAEIIEVGKLRLEAIHNPGHTAGSVSFKVQGAPLLFSGDTLFPGGPGNTKLDGGDFATIIHSIDTSLFTLPPDTIVMPGHGVRHHHRPRAPAARRLGRTWLVTPRPLPHRRHAATLTFDDFLESRSAGFDVVRLVLAFLVLVSHTWPLGGFGSEPLSPLAPKVLTLGGFAVGAFFALSGLLVGRSAINRPSGKFAKARVARIMPALWVAILVSAFVVALIGWVHRHRRRSADSSRFARTARSPTWDERRPCPCRSRTASLDVFVNDTPYGIATKGSFINGSLWTLPYEVRCYVVIGLVADRGPQVRDSPHDHRSRGASRWLIAIGYWKRVDLTSFVIGPYADRQLAAFLFVFLSGTLVAAWAHKITLFGWVPVAAFVVAVVLGRGPAFWSEHITQASMALVLPPIAALVTPRGATASGRGPVVRLVPLRMADAATRRALPLVISTGDVHRNLDADGSHLRRGQLVHRRTAGNGLDASTMSDTDDHPPALRYDQRPADHTPIHTDALPATPTRDRNIVASAWVEAPAELLALGADLPDRPEAEYKRRIGDWLLWRAGPAAGGDARYWACRSR